MFVKLAGWRVELRLTPAALAESVASRYSRFACAAADDVDFVVAVQSELPGPAGAAPTASLLHASLTNKGEVYLLDGASFYGMIDLSRGWAELRTRSDEPTRESEYFLRIAFALFALRRDGLLLHCAGLLRRGVAGIGLSCTSDDTRHVDLFVGQSGSGKSTVVALSQAADRAAALGDDLILLRREARGWWAYGTPFWNFATTRRESEAESGAVGGIYKLIQDREVFVEPMSRAAGAAELLANAPVVNGQPELLPILMDRCRELADVVGVRRLHFRKDDAFWDVIAQEAPC